MKSLSLLFFAVIMTLASCTESSLIAPAASVQGGTHLRGGCDVDQQYLDDLGTDLANYYGVSPNEVTVTYCCQNAQGDHEFPFEITSSTVNGTGLYALEDLCDEFSADFIVEDDLAGF